MQQQPPVPTQPITPEGENLTKVQKFTEVLNAVKEPVTLDMLLDFADIKLDELSPEEYQEVNALLLANEVKQDDGTTKYFAGGNGSVLGNKIIADKMWGDLFD